MATGKCVAVGAALAVGGFLVACLAAVVAVLVMVGDDELFANDPDSHSY